MPANTQEADITLEKEVPGGSQSKASLSAWVSVHHMHACCPWRPEEGTGHSGTEVTDGGEP